MKYSAAVLAFAGSALAAGGADAVNQVLQQIASDLKEFDTVIKGYSGGSTDQLTAASKKIEQTTSSGASTIASGAELSLTDAVGITSNVQSLQTTLDATLGDLKQIGEKLASGGHCSTIQEQLKSQAKSAQALQDAITGKAPAETKAVASQLGGAIGASIQDTDSYFAKACANAPSGGAASSGSSAPSGGAASSGSSSPSGGSSSSPSGGHGASSGGHGEMGSSTSGGHGSKTNKAAKTTSGPKPATYTGAASTLTAPFLGALALAVFAL